MKSETIDFLAKAREDLSDAKTIANVGLSKVAARSAYYAAFHTAEAIVFERLGQIAKTHTGVRTALAQLMRNEPDIDKTFLTFLAQAYKYKAISDYSVGHNASVTMADAEGAIARAEAFLVAITTLLTRD